MSREVKKVPISRFNIPIQHPILAEYTADYGEEILTPPARQTPTKAERTGIQQEREWVRRVQQSPKQTQDQGRPDQGMPYLPPFRQSVMPPERISDTQSPLNFLNLEETETTTGNSEPDSDPTQRQRQQPQEQRQQQLQLHPHHQQEQEQQGRQWRALNVQPWRQNFKRFSGMRRTEVTELTRKDVNETVRGSPVGKYEESKSTDDSQHGVHQLSALATQLYIASYLIFFAIFGTLARMGLEALTFYPGAPVVFSELWANFSGSVIMGFLVEDRALFREEWGMPNYHNAIQRARAQVRNLESGLSAGSPVDLYAAKRAHGAMKKTIPLYIGLVTGFCGSFTTFGSFMRDCFLALSNDLPTPLNHPQDSSPIGSTVHRNPGYSFMAVTAVILVTIALCMSGFFLGGHLALFVSPITPTLPFRFTRGFLDPFGVILGWACWIGAILMSIFPPDSSYSSLETWRGQALFAIVFGPIGCLMRYYISLLLNPTYPSFPLGTFFCNAFGTMVLGMSWDFQHVPLGGHVGCQVLQGIESGFCGCMTTVSTWVSELSALKKKYAYRYGIVTVSVALGTLVCIMGGLKWTRGFSEVKCTH